MEFCWTCRALFVYLCSKDLSKLHTDDIQPGSPHELLVSLSKRETTYARVFETLCRWVLHIGLVNSYLDNGYLLLLLVRHAPLGVRSTKRRHQSPEWTILSHSYRLIQGEIVRPQVLLDSLHPRSLRTSWWFPPVLRRGSSYDTPGICLAEIAL